MTDVPGGPDGRAEPRRDFEQGKPAAYGGQAPKADWRMYARITGWLIVAILATAFLLKNKNPVTVDFVFFEATVPTFVALIVSGVLGFLLGGSLMWWTARRKRKAAERAG